MVPEKYVGNMWDNFGMPLPQESLCMNFNNRFLRFCLFRAAATSLASNGLEMYKLH